MGHVTLCMVLEGCVLPGALAELELVPCVVELRQD